MTHHADLARKPAPQPGTAADAAQFGAASAVAQLAETAQLLNAAAPAVAQRALAARLNTARPARVIGRPSSGGVIQRMHQPPVGDGQPQPEANWADFNSPEALAAFGQQPHAQQHGGQDNWANFGGAEAQAAFGNANHIAQPPAPAPATEVDIGGHKTLATPMFTKSMGNCITIVAYNAASGRACFYHWNTTFSYETDDSRRLRNARGKMEYPLLVRPAKIAEAKGVVDQELGAPAVYHIVMGLEWRAGAGGDSLAYTRTQFIASLNDIFHPATLDSAGHTKARWSANHVLTGE